MFPGTAISSTTSCRFSGFENRRSSSWRTFQTLCATRAVQLDGDVTPTSLRGHDTREHRFSPIIWHTRKSATASTSSVVARRSGRFRLA